MRSAVGEEQRTHGGRRPGAGRKRGKYRLDAPHRSRPKFAAPTPVHVTMRCHRWVLELRDERVFAALSDVVARYRDRDDFRVVHLSIQDTHLHAIVEAATDRALDHGMRSFTINAARAIHRVFGGCDRVFYRYHSTLVTTPRYARHVLAYVLGNWRRHRKDFANGRLLPALLDPFSSAISFDGWSRRFRVPDGYTPLPVSPPRTHLMRRGWAYRGPLDPHAAPGPPW